MTQIYSLEAAIRWMQENEATYAAPQSNLKCVGIHIGMQGPTCEIFHLDYRRDSEGDWRYTFNCYSNHYFLALGEPKEIHAQIRDFSKLSVSEFLYSPEETKDLGYAFISAENIKEMSGRQIAKLIYPNLEELEKALVVKNTLTYLATAKLNIRSFVPQHAND